jgi:sugar phosphate isomerase/epimerase
VLRAELPAAILPGMSYRVFAMDTCFYSPLGAYEFDARCEMLRELGYDATYLTTWSEVSWNDVSRLAGVKSRFGLEVAAVYVTLDLAGDEKHENNARIVRLLESVEGCSHIEMAVKSSGANPQSSDPDGNDRVRRWLDRLLPTAERRVLTVSLYPHINFWLDRIEIAVRVCREVNRPSLRAVFCGFHWFAADGKNLSARLEEAAPFLRSVNLCGSRRAATHPQSMPATIEPLDQGELDNFAVLGLLRKIGYEGMVGFQGYSMGGDAYAYLKRSLAALRDMERRLDAHPSWAQLRTA